MPADLLNAMHHGFEHLVFTSSSYADELKGNLMHFLRGQNFYAGRCKSGLCGCAIRDQSLFTFLQ